MHVLTIHERLRVSDVLAGSGGGASLGLEVMVFEGSGCSVCLGGTAELEEVEVGEGRGTV